MSLLSDNLVLKLENWLLFGFQLWKYLKILKRFLVASCIGEILDATNIDLCWQVSNLIERRGEERRGEEGKNSVKASSHISE